MCRIFPGRFARRRWAFGPGMRVLDCCAAPGGKSFTLAQRMEDAGELIAGDLYPQKAALIQKGAERLGLFSIRAVTVDAGVFSPQLGLFDRVLCDVPCWDLGLSGVSRKSTTKIWIPCGIYLLFSIKFWKPPHNM